MSDRGGWQPLSEPRRSEGRTGVRTAISTSPFTRLARVHALAVAADTLVATSLAGSLFFSIPTGEARGRVALYLLLTFAPFAIVGPLIGPALDRTKGGRRLLVVGTGVARAVLCLFMARHVDSLLLFPLAFGILVLGKAYAIARSALVPTVVASDAELVEANSRLSLVSGIVGFVAAGPGVLTLNVFGAEWTLVLAAIVGSGQAIAALMLPATTVAPEPPDATEEAELRGAGVVLASEAMGLLRGVVGFLTFLIAFDLRGGGDDSPVPIGLGIGRAVRGAAGFPIEDGSGGGAPAWHFGLALGASVLGSLLGAVLAPRLRAVTSEERILQGVLAGGIGAALAAAVIGNLLGAVLIALAVGLAASAGKLAFDSIVQRDAPDANRGRSFARFETRFQLIWVIGGFVPVVVALPARVGYLIVAIAAGFALFSYLSGLRHGPRRPPHLATATPAAEAALFADPAQPPSLGIGELDPG
ncbi:MAG: hypothetical protein ACRD0G_02640 [Acidimicrobiales bacterium]